MNRYVYIELGKTMALQKQFQFVYDLIDSCRSPDVYDFDFLF